MKRRQQLNPEVKAAVHDILHGTDVNNNTEWLQREYIRLMYREANKLRSEKIQKESNSKQNVDKVPNNGNVSDTTGTIEQ